MTLTVSKSEHIGHKQWLGLAERFPNFTLHIDQNTCLKTHNNKELVLHHILSLPYDEELFAFATAFAKEHLNRLCQTEGNFQGYSPLHTAAYAGNLEAVKKTYRPETS